MGAIMADHLHFHIGRAEFVFHGCAPLLEQVLAAVQQLQDQEILQMAALDTLLSEVSETRGQVDSLITLTAGLAQYIRDNIGNDEALLEAAAQLDGLQTDIQAAVDANPIPTSDDTPAG